MKMDFVVVEDVKILVIKNVYLLDRFIGYFWFLEIVGINL